MENLNKDGIQSGSDGNGKRGPIIDRRFNKKLGQKISSLKSKEQKLPRLQNERDNLRGALERGYRIEEKSDTGKKEHIKLSTIDRKIYTGKVKVLDNDMFDTQEEISSLEAEIKTLQGNKNNDFGKKLADKRHIRTVNNLTDSVFKRIESISKEGEPEELTQIKDQLSRKENDAANKSLMQFLATRDASILKRLEKSRKEVREEVISNTLQKLTVA